MEQAFKVIKSDDNLIVTEKGGETLDRILNICDPKKFVLCGGLNIYHYFKKNNLSVPFTIGQRDIDIKIVDLKSLRELLENSKEDFEISHYHDYAKKRGDYHHIDRFYGVLVDRKNKVKVDVFDMQNFVPQELSEINYKGGRILVRTLEDQIVTKMLETYRILGTSCQENALDPKQFAELYWIISISNPLKIQKLWSSHPYNNNLRDIFPMEIPETFEEAYTRSLSWMYHHPEIVSKFGEGKREKENVSCAECISEAGFSLKK